MRLRSKILKHGRDGIGLTIRKLDDDLELSGLLFPLIRYMRWSAARTPDDIYLLWVPPRTVSRIKLFPPGDVPVTGELAIRGAVGGPWDRLTMDLRNHYIYQSIRAHLLDGVPWPETQIYEHPKYQHDPERARRRCEKIEAIIASIRADGYRPQHEFTEVSGAPHSWIDDVHIGDEIVVGLDRHGNLFQLMNGRHRLAVAHLLNVERIPVVLSLYHPRGSDAIPSDAARLGSEYDGVAAARPGRSAI